MNEIQEVRQDTGIQPVSNWDAINTALIKGDLCKLSPQEKHALYLKTCESVGLNHLTQPFGYIVLNGKERLYATRNCTDQLCRIHGISIVDTEEKFDEKTRIYSVKVKMQDKAGRYGINRGDVFIPTTMMGLDLANAYMKCHTKALRRCTLSMVGLSFLDETEVEDIPRYDAPKVSVKFIDATKKRQIAELFKAKATTNPDLKENFRKSFPTIDFNTLTDVQWSEVTEWLNQQ